MISPNENDDEYEEEEVLMCVSFPLLENVSLLDDPNTEIEIVGIETEHPEIRIHNIQLQGQHEVNIGSMMVFTEPQTDIATTTANTSSNVGGAGQSKSDVELIGMSINYIRCGLKQVILPTADTSASAEDQAVMPMDITH